MKKTELVLLMLQYVERNIISLHKNLYKYTEPINMECTAESGMVIYGT